jgi:hypothetical protein
LRSRVSDPRFEELNMPRYLWRLANDVNRFEDDAARETMLGLLAAKGWSPRSTAQRVKEIVGNLLRPSLWRWHLVSLITPAFSKPFWLFLAERFRVPPPDGNNFEFANREEGVAYVNRFHGPNRGRWSRFVVDGEVLGKVLVSEVAR